MFVLCLISIPSGAGEVRVAVDTDFTDAIMAITPMFEKTTGHTVKISYGSTGKLYAQIQNGTAYDVFMAGDSEFPTKAIKSGYAIAGSQFVYARDKLVLWSVSPCLFQDGETYLRGSTFDHLAIANPKTSPYGFAARDAMDMLGIWNELQEKLMPADSMARVFQLVADDEADIGFVTASQLRNWTGDKGSSWKIPEEFYDSLDKTAVLLRHGKENPAVYAFIDFLQSAPARKIIEDYGYGL
jgi:molybdate transport system substrate-binding protein